MLRPPKTLTERDSKNLLWLRMNLSEIVEGIPETVCQYQEDSYSKEFRSLLLRVFREKKSDVYMVLDKTIFHPKSGGQPSDRGRLLGSDFEIEVKKALFTKNVVVHYGKIIHGEPTEGEEVSGFIDWEWRYLLMRRHTANHLMDYCISRTTGRWAETTDSWLEDPCYVGYRGRGLSETELRQVEDMANDMIGKGGGVQVENVTLEELKRRNPHAPNIYRLPSLDVYRIVTIEGCDPIPCGGTHLKNINEIGNFAITNQTIVESGYRIYYKVE